MANPNSPQTTSILTVTQACWALLVAIFIVMISNSLQGTLLALRASIEQFDIATTGYVMSGYFVGLVVGSLTIIDLVQRVGHIRVFAALASLASIIPLVQAMIIDPYVWFAGRVLTGFCYAGIFIIAESWLNDRADNKTRGKILSIYIVLLVGGMGIGPLFLNLSHPSSVELFILASVLVSLALMPILLAASQAPNVEAPKRIKIMELYRLSPLGVAGAFAVGMSNGALVGMTAVYGYSLGYTIAEISILTSLIYLGCVILQFPIGYISDAFDRRKVIIAVTFCAALVPLYSSTLDTVSIYPTMIMFFLLGGFSFSMYSLCVSHANDRLESDQMLGGSATLALIIGVGAVMGSPIISYAMAYFGNVGYLWYFVIIHFAIGLFALYRMTRSAATPMDEQDTTYSTIQVSTIAPAFTTETYQEINENIDNAENVELTEDTPRTDQ